VVGVFNVRKQNKVSNYRRGARQEFPSIIEKLANSRELFHKLGSDLFFGSFSILKAQFHAINSSLISNALELVCSCLLLRRRAKE